VWNKHGKEVIRASRDVDDDGSMWETTLQDLNGSSVSGVASQELKGSMEGDAEYNMINLKENNDVNINADMLRRAREVRELHGCLGHPSNDVMKVMSDHSTSPDIRVTSRDVDNAERWLEPCTPCTPYLEGKMIARE
jgi:hypothetical protein